MVIDAHAHVWRFDPVRYPWRPFAAGTPIPARDATVESLLAEMDAAGVARAVLVQPSIYGDDHRYLRDALAAAPGRFAAVGLVDPAAPDAAARLQTLTNAVPLRGVRLRLLGPATGSVEAADATGVLAAAAESALVVSVLTDPPGLARVAALATRHPTLRFVVDHLGRPDLARPGDRSPGEALIRLASAPNVAVKLSGFYAFSRQPFPHPDCRPLVERVVSAFGPARLLWGSDAPLVRRACSYSAAVEHGRLLVPGAANQAREQVLHDNAYRWYW